MSLPCNGKSEAVRALAAYIAIPVVTILGAALAMAINPETAAGSPNYMQNYWLLRGVRSALLVSTLLIAVGLWFVTCLFLVRAKRRPYAWSTLALFGPVGLIALTMLGSKRADGDDPYDGWLRQMTRAMRLVYQVMLFLVIVVAADQVVVVKRPLVIIWQSYITGFPVQDIVQQQMASSGMWAFGETMETLYLIVLFYLLCPLCFNAAARWRRLRAESKA